MARGPKKHLKRLHAPRSWMLSKMAGIFAPRPSTGPHKMRESIPLIIILRNRLKYALNGREVQAITMNRHVLVDGRVRTDTTFPTGFMDVVSIPKTGEHFRILYDVKGRFAVHPIPEEEAKYKLCKVVKVMLAKKGIPFLVTHDGRTIRYPDPAIKAKDTIKLDLETNKIVEHIKFEVGNLCMITGGRNIGRVGLLNDVEHHEGSPDIVHVKDAANNVFATRVSNLFVLGSQGKSLVTLPKRKGLKKTIAEDREYRLKSGK